MSPSARVYHCKNLDVSKHCEVHVFDNCKAFNDLLDQEAVEEEGVIKRHELRDQS